MEALKAGVTGKVMRMRNHRVKMAIFGMVLLFSFLTACEGFPADLWLWMRVSGITPAYAVSGSTVTLTVAGSNLTGVSSVAFSSAGITVVSYRILDPQRMLVTIRVSPLAPPGFCNLILFSGFRSYTYVNIFEIRTL